MAASHSGCWVTAAILVLASLNVALASLDGLSRVILYEEDPGGNVVVNRFDEEPERMNLVPIVGTFNPSPRLASCAFLGEGRSPVFGNCSRYLECEFVNATTTTIEGFQRRIVECPIGLWFSKDLGDCATRETDECPYGQLVPNPVDMPQSNPLQRSAAPGTCTAAGEFVNPGCRSFYSCIATSTPGVFHRFTYICGVGYLWDEGSCWPESQVQCKVPIEGLDCFRECVAGQTRVCRYKFIVEEYATMSTVYCKNCPFTASDCDLPGCIAAGGVSKLVKAINRGVPGPVIQACKGDTLEVEVQNRLSAGSVTIHWHGLHQRATPHMDGVPFMTQCPVLPGNSFLYRMKADVSGTHLYHSHMGHQESDGMFGAMIIREPRLNEFGIASRYDEDLPQHLMLIWHWFSRAADIESSDTRYGSLRREGFGYIINGKGAVEQLFSKDSSSPAAGTRVPTPVETYHVQTGLKYRFRSIFNSALNCPALVSVDGHAMDIIATDGRPVLKHTGLVDSFLISAGERVDFVLHPHWSINTARRSFLIRVRGLNDCDDRKNGVHQYAILRYDNSTDDPNANSEGPPTYANAIRSGVGFNLNRDLANTNSYYIQARSLEASKDANVVLDAKISGTPAKTFYIDARFNRYVETANIQFVYPQLNNITWQSPPFPPLTQPSSVTPSTFCVPGAPTNCQNGLCRCAQMLEVGLNELVELVLVDTGGNPGIGHPFHLHGYAFRVVAMGTFNEATSVQKMKDLVNGNSITRSFNGPLKDVVLVPARGYAVVRFYADNPGYWLFHCHISEHMAQGMALVFKVGTHAQMVAPPTNFPKCGNFA